MSTQAEMMTKARKALEGFHRRTRGAAGTRGLAQSEIDLQVALGEALSWIQSVSADKYPPVPASLAAEFSNGAEATEAWHQYCDAKDPRAAAQVGDRAESDFNEICDAMSEQRLVCTRELGHAGKHIAENTTEVVACWLATEPANEPDADAVERVAQALYGLSIRAYSGPKPKWEDSRAWQGIMRERAEVAIAALTQGHES